MALGKPWKNPYLSLGLQDNLSGFAFINPFVSRKHLRHFVGGDVSHSQGGVHDLFKATRPGQIQIQNWTCPSPKSQVVSKYLSDSLSDVLLIKGSWCVPQSSRFFREQDISPLLGSERR